MSFLFPLALALAAILPIVVLAVHLLRGANRRLRVPAVFLWADLEQSTGGQERRRWPPLTLLLLLQIIAVVLLAAALARPASPVDPPPTHLVLVIDASTSMQATDVRPSRFASAVGQAREQLDDLSLTDTASLIRAGATATLVATGSPQQARSALEDLRPEIGPAALEHAIALASARLAETPELEGRIVVFTDGAGPEIEAPATLAGPVEFVTVSGNNPRANQSIARVETRTVPDGSGARQLFVELANFDSEPAQRPVTVVATESGEEIAGFDVTIPERGTTSLVLDVPAGVRQLTVHLAGDGDILPLDDTAEVDLPDVIAGTVRVTLVSNGSGSLERALRALPWVELAVIDVAEMETGAATAPADLTVLDGMIPDELPPGPLLVVNPPATNHLLRVEDYPTPLTVSSSDAEHPLLQEIDIRSFRLERGLAVEPLAWARTVVETPAGPAVLEGRLDGRSVVILAFDPAQSRLDRSIAFPLLVHNAVAHLAGTGVGLAVAPGQPVEVAVPDGRSALVVAPDGNRTRLRSDAGRVRVTDTTLPGRYTVLDAANEQHVLLAFSVNLLDVEESDVRPRLELERIDRTPPAGDETESPLTPLVEHWRLLVAAALLLLGLEWIVYVRRGHG
jgi:Ca-activated chloride channel homolog